MRTIVILFIMLQFAMAMVHPSKAFAAQTTKIVTIATGSPVPIVTLAAGDRVDIQAKLKSPDPDENGEGEPLIITSSGGFSITLTRYAQARSVSFTASSNGETLSAFIAGFDGDESGIVTVTVNSTEKKRFTEEQKAAFANASAKLNTLAGFLQTVGSACALAGKFQAICSFASNALTGVTWVLSGHLNQLALDPSDPNFRTIAQPDPPSLPELAIGEGVTQDEANAFNALLVNMEQSIGFARAMITAINRAQGASDAGEGAFETTQLQAASAFGAQLSKLLTLQVSLYSGLKATLNTAGFPALQVSSSQVLSFEIQVAFGGGLPESLKANLALLGADQATIADIQDLAFVQDVNEAAGSFPDKLVESPLLSALQAAASLLSPDIVPPVISVHADRSTLWPPDGKTVQVNVIGGITDEGSGVDPSTVSFSVKDEYGVFQPHGSIALNADGTYSFAVALEARRNGEDRDGRLYTIEIRASDVAGNAASASTTVTVLHDQR